MKVAALRLPGKCANFHIMQGRILSDILQDLPEEWLPTSYEDAFKLYTYFYYTIAAISTNERKVPETDEDLVDYFLRVKFVFEKAIKFIMNTSNLTPSKILGEIDRIRRNVQYSNDVNDNGDVTIN
jgi:hypothetical protein